MSLDRPSQHERRFKGIRGASYPRLLSRTLLLLFLLVFVGVSFSFEAEPEWSEWTKWPLGSRPRELQSNGGTNTSVTRSSGEVSASADNSTAGTASPSITDNVTEATSTPAAFSNTSAATTTSPSTAPSTAAPTLPLDSVAMPKAVDILACFKHLKVADSNRNYLLTEEEYIDFVHQVVSHDFNHSLASIPGQEAIWGNTLKTLPAGIQATYKDLNQGGTIPVFGYKTDETRPVSTEQQKFLIKVCANTEIAVYQVLQQVDPATSTAEQAMSIPKIQIGAVNSSFDFKNQVGLRAQDLQPGRSNRDDLDLAYQTFVLQVVGDQLGTTLTPPIGAPSSKSITGSRRRRELTVALDPNLSKIYQIDDVLCRGEKPNLAHSLKKEWCMQAYGSSDIYFLGEDAVSLADQYSKAMQDATKHGDLQKLLKQLAPESQLTITGDAPDILPPSPTTAPTVAPVAVPTAAPHVITVPNSTNHTPFINSTGSPGFSGGSRGPNLKLILTLAGVLFLVNLCIIGVSLFMCWRDRNANPLIHDDGDDLEPYYKNKHAQDSENDSDDEQEMVSNPPTLEEIEEANRMPYSAPAPAPAPVLTSVAAQDAIERERILSRSQANTAGPTMEEIAMAMGSSKPLPPPSDAGHEDDDHGEKLKVDGGELA